MVFLHYPQQPEHTPQPTPQRTTPNGKQPNLQEDDADVPHITGGNSQQFSRMIAGTLVRVNCNEHLSPQVDWLFSILEEYASVQPPFDGMMFELGMSVLSFVAHDDGSLHMYEPDFENDPLENAVDDITVTLMLITQHQFMISATKTEDSAIIPRFDDTVVLRKGVLQEDRIFLERAALDPEAEQYSGWYIGSMSEHEQPEDGTAVQLDEESFSEDDYEALYVYQLIELRPTLVQLLCLPPEYAVILDGSTIEGVFNADGENVWYDEALDDGESNEKNDGDDR
jgi:hypothetical protein